MRWISGQLMVGPWPPDIPPSRSPTSATVQSGGYRCESDGREVAEADEVGELTVKLDNVLDSDTVEVAAEDELVDLAVATSEVEELPLVLAPPGLTTFAQADVQLRDVQ